MGMQLRSSSACFHAVVMGMSVVAAGAPPRVIEAVPDHADVAVDPVLTVLRITFDQDMQQDGFSLCGGGPMFPTVVARPRWVDACTLVVPVSLEAGKRYELSVNCPSARNFRSAAGESAEIYPITFITAHEGEVGPAIDAERARELTVALRRAMDERWAHRDAHGVQWDDRFAEMRDRLEGARTPAAFARASAEFLRAGEDLHTTVEVNGVRLGTGRRVVSPNVNWGRLAQLVPGWREFAGGAAGQFEDGVGYIAISTWMGGDDAAAVLEALRGLEGAPALIVDIRMNAGGNEVMAQRIAACFVEERHVYSTNLIRDPSSERGWAGPFERAVLPAADGPRFGGKVAVLMGPACMSTTESFVLMMRREGKRELFGTRTWGSSGNPRPVEIGEGVTVYFSSWRDMTPEGVALEGVGIAPDHEVAWRAADRDPVLEAALAWLRAGGR
jgi:hypothetical protein